MTALMTTPCVQHVGRFNEFGYGKVGRGTLAHRKAWEDTHGPIPAGMVVCHRCDNRACVNVEHLFLGTQADNMRDAASKGRLNKAYSLTAAEAQRIRDAYAAGGLSIRGVARQFGLSYGLAYRTLNEPRRDLDAA